MRYRINLSAQLLDMPKDNPKPYYLLQNIRAGIIEGRYAAGQSLREEALGTEFAVSRGPIREALRLLELRGLVTHVPRRGYRVRAYSRKTIEDLYKLRAKLERNAVEALAIDGLVGALRDSNERMAASYAAGATLPMTSLNRV
jgi:DNA-binding GntR family transcriptional regulator